LKGFLPGVLESRLSASISSNPGNPKVIKPSKVISTNDRKVNESQRLFEQQA